MLTAVNWSHKQYNVCDVEAGLLTHVTVYAAGRTTSDQELEEMLESGNPAIFTQGVSNKSVHLYSP